MMNNKKEKSRIIEASDSDLDMLRYKGPGSEPPNLAKFVEAVMQKEFTATEESDV